MVIVSLHVRLCVTDMDVEVINVGAFCSVCVLSFCFGTEGGGGDGGGMQDSDTDAGALILQDVVRSVSLRSHACHPDP